MDNLADLAFLPAMVEIPRVTPIESSIWVPWRTEENNVPDITDFHLSTCLLHFTKKTSSLLSTFTYCCDHDGVIEETKSNKGDGVVQQNCK